MRNKRAILVAIACLMSPGVCPMGAYAQDYPNQPIKAHRSESSRRTLGILFRAPSLKRRHRLLVSRSFSEYRAGASTTIGTAAAAKADPDGYTVLALPSSGTGAVAIKKQLRYNLETDFSPIAGIGTVPWCSLSGQG